MTQKDAIQEARHKDAIQEARKRAYRYQFEDGLLEIAQGGAFALFGLGLWWVDSLALIDAANKWLFALGFLAFTVFIAVVVVRFTLRYKNKLVFPRTGTVNREEQPKEEARSALIMILLALAIAAAAIWLDDWFVSTTTIIGATLTLILLATAARAGILRMQLVAVLPLVMSIPLSYLQIEETLASAIVLGATGLAGLMAGALALRNYLAKNPAQDDERA